MFIIYSPRSAFRRLAKELGVTAVFPYQNRMIRRSRLLKRVVNIGCVRAELPTGTMNADLSIAISKAKTFAMLDGIGVRHPPVFSTPEEAAEWPHGWLGRRDGLSGGKGISIFERGQLPLQAAQYDFIVGIIPGKAEYRVHIGRDSDGNWRVIATQQKTGVKDNPNVIRNHANGVIYSMQPLKMSAEGQARAADWARKAVEGAGLDFGAVDLMQSTDGKLYMLEINSAPGISSEPMFEAYKDYFQRFLEEG